MTDEIDDLDPGMRRLIDAHPLIFRGQAPAWSYVMPGWYAIVDQLCFDIEVALGLERCEEIEVRQIKEKFGELCFYYRLGEREDLHLNVMTPTSRHHLVMRSPAIAGSDEQEEEPVVMQLRELAKAAREASTKTCETCGAPGEVRDARGWYTALCEQHLAEKLVKPQAEEGS